MSPVITIANTLGALMAGCLAAVALSAILGFQTFLYFQIFPTDTLKYKLLVLWTWATDATHTLLVCITIWRYLVANFEDGNIVKHIEPTQEMVDAVLVFTLNDGGLTCAVVFAAIACVLKLPGTFVWIGIHFTIAKLYANSVLATYGFKIALSHLLIKPPNRLNLRNFYRYRHRPMGIPLHTRQGTQNLNIRAALSGNRATMTMSHDKLPGVVSSRPNERNLSGMEVYIDQQVEYNVAVRVAADDCVDIGDSEDSMKAPSMDRVRVTAV
ncbi:hypothetical protein HMN09_00873700 [Mycena chlorophos]|uniref:DUF6534 domain-containing protein n=1 Tax=Mycena chlorophos TaxID=658473 RepID=A0A8H6SP31_MYCCL|nr:hypothetical protein HMN09_00873700 [Mycena chlorophos]